MAYKTDEEAKLLAEAESQTYPEYESGAEQSEKEAGETGNEEEESPQPSQVKSFVVPRAQSLGQGAGAAAGGLVRGVSGIYAPMPGTPSTREANGDDLSDLFRGIQKDDPDVRIDDVVDVHPEDVMGGPEDMADLVEINDPDVLGENMEDLFEPPPMDVGPPRRTTPRSQPRRRPTTPTGMSGVGY